MRNRFLKIGIGAVFVSLLMISSATTTLATTEKQTPQKTNLQSIEQHLLEIQSKNTLPLSKDQSQETPDTIEIICQVGKERTTKQIPASAIDDIMSLAKEKKQSFLTIYNKYSTPEQVEQAFTDVQPFFESLVTNGLTTQSVDDMNNMFYKIRDMIKKPKRDPFGPKPLGG